MSVSEELLDVVDENDRVVDVKTRGEIHASHLMHRAIHILLFNSKGEVFLQKRSMSKDENPGLWDSSAAGHVDSGESYLACAVREIEEELGIVPSEPMEALFKLPPIAETGFEHSMIYRYYYDGPLCLQAEEIEAGIWVTTEALQQWVEAQDDSLTENLILIWKRYREFNHNLQ
ncbi:MAG: NUDIX domain-containing protein [Pseudomonadota bacterium]